MKTVVTEDVEIAASFIRGGGTVAFPTETVYGLGANVFDEAAVAKIFEAKRRPADNPLIAHVASVGQIAELATEVTERAERFIQAFFPGPLTVVVRKKKNVPLIASAGLDTIGVRMPRGELAQTFLKACGVSVVAPSANLSGRPSPTTWEAVLEDLDGRIDCILQGEPTEIGLESTVVDCTGDVPVLLRTGAVSLDALRAVVSETRVVSAGSAATSRSPGLKHRHYTPSAEVRLVSDAEADADRKDAAWIGVGGIDPDSGFALTKVCSSVEEYAASVFEFFRECDRRGIRVIYCQTATESGIGAALMDRLRRARNS